MDYINLSDEMFLKEVFKLYRNKSREVLDFLKINPYIMERFKILVSDHKVKNADLYSAHVFINYYDF